MGALPPVEWDTVGVECSTMMVVGSQVSEAGRVGLGGSSDTGATEEGAEAEGTGVIDAVGSTESPDSEGTADELAGRSDREEGE